VNRERKTFELPWRGSFPRACATAGALLASLGGVAHGEPPPSLRRGDLAERFLEQERARRKLDSPWTLTLCAQETSRTAGLLVALCNAGGTAHADSGWVDFYQLEESSGAVRVNARRLHVESGAGFGNTGEVKPIHLGEHAPAFVIEGVYCNQGSCAGHLTVVALRRGAFRTLAELHPWLSNTGEARCELSNTCFDVTITLHPKPNARRSEPHDLVVMVAGTQAKRKVRRLHVLRFDSRRGEYAVPRMLRPSDDPVPPT
jgi:hypothetical protein